MLFVFFISNILSIGFVVGVFNILRKRYKIRPAFFKEKILYFLFFMILCLSSVVSALYMWPNIGWLIWIYMSLVSFIVEICLINFFPTTYYKILNFFSFK